LHDDEDEEFTTTIGPLYAAPRHIALAGYGICWFFVCPKEIA
jgi:hypothetical protein